MGFSAIQLSIIAIGGRRKGICFFVPNFILFVVFYHSLRNLYRFFYLGSSVRRLFNQKKEKGLDTISLNNSVYVHSDMVFFPFHRVLG